MSSGLAFDIKIFGIDELTYKFSTLPLIVRTAVRGAQRTTAQRIVKRAKELVPVDTGALKRSIRARWSPTNPNVRQVIADAPKLNNPSESYAPYVEYGRHKFNQQDAQPFLRPAMQQIGTQYYDDIGVALRGAIAEAGL